MAHYLRLVVKRTFNYPSTPYKPLREDQFRIVRIYKDSFSNSLSCGLKTVSWTRPPKYTALSYVWGTEQYSHYIKLDSCSIKITANLAEALEGLWNLDGTRWWWIDALCIDQSNLSERGHQVKRMPWIYAYAKQVLIYLRTEYPLDSLNSAIDASHKPLLVGIEPAVPDPIAVQYHTLCKNPYWNRVWVAQEVAHAQDVLILLTGGYTLAYHKIVRPDCLDTLKNAFTIVLQGVSSSNARAHFEMAYRNGPARMGMAGSARKRTAIGRDPRGLNQQQGLWLSTMQGKQCKDPRDYIYALLYLFPSKLQRAISIDYDIPVFQVFTSFTRLYVEITKDLSIIIWGKSKAVHPSIPSWVGNFCDGAADPFTSYDFHLRRLSSHVPNAWFGKNKAGVRGKFIGEVVGTSSLGLGPETMLDFLELHKDSNTRRKLGRTLSLGQSDNLSFSEDALEPLWESRRIFSMRLNSNEKPFGKRREFDIGIGPKHMCPGDKVFLIFGCSPMAVLRPVGNKYRIVGDAFVYRTEGYYDDCKDPEEIVLI
jgi:hypothetical protein